MNKIKITMLGASNAGKTCFLLGMYNAMKRGVRGYTFTAQNLDIDLDLTDLWEQIVDPQSGQDRWPNPTRETTTYEFGYCYGLKRIISFDWIDYRGNVLRDRSEAKDQAELLNHLRESASLLICVNGELLKEPIKDREDEVSAKAAITRITGFIQHHVPHDVRPSVAIMITKSDLLRGRNTQEVIEEIKELFNPLFASDAHWSVMICPVTLGPGLRDNREQGTIAPVNLHLPVSYAVYQAFQQEIARVEGSVDYYSVKKAELSRNWLSRLVNSGEIEGMDRRIKENKSDMQEIQNYIQNMGRDLLQKVPMYYNGKEVGLG